MSLENMEGNKIQDLEKKFTSCMNELRDIEKFVLESLNDLDDSGREFRFDMFTRHFAEAFTHSKLLKNIENAIKNKEIKGLDLLISELESKMGFFRMFKDKKWEPPT